MGNTKRVTILGIAQACGISKTTVACALNGRTASKVSPEKISLITTTATRLGYVVNHSAQSLRSRKNYAIGVMLPEPANNFYGRMILNLQKKLAQKGYAALFSFWNTPSDVGNINQTLKMLVSRGVDGIITCELDGVHFENSPVPVVFWQIPPANFDSVGSYSCIKEIYRKVVCILKEKSCKSFAVMSPYMGRSRTKQVLEVLEQEGVYPRPEHCIEKVNSYETAWEAMRRMLSLPSLPDVVLGNNDVIAMGAMSCALNAGIKVPGEMKFVGFDGIEEARYFFPSLTTFSVSVDEVTEKLIWLLFRRIENRDSAPLNLQVEAQLIIGGSI